MAKTEMDAFNEGEAPSEDNKEVGWNTQEDQAICAVCDALFIPAPDRPPIFCPACKQGLAEILQL